MRCLRISLHQPAITVIDHLASWPAPLSPISVTAFAISIATAARDQTRFVAAASPSLPVTAPPAPDIGASTKCNPRLRASACSSRATLADAVVLSTAIASLAMPAKAPFSPSITPRKSSSLPTHEKTICAPAAASRGVLADLPPYSCAHCCAFFSCGVNGAAWPALARWHHRIAHHARPRRQTGGQPIVVLYS